MYILINVLDAVKSSATNAAPSGKIVAVHSGTSVGSVSWPIRLLIKRLKPMQSLQFGKMSSIKQWSYFANTKMLLVDIKRSHNG